MTNVADSSFTQRIQNTDLPFLHIYQLTKIHQLAFASPLKDVGVKKKSSFVELLDQ